MPKPFDASLKELIRSYPADWLRHLGFPVEEPLEVLSADLSAVTAAADTLIRVGERIVHIDVESGPDETLARRMLFYNVHAHHHTGLPVQSVVVLLRPKAQRANLIDRVEYEGLSFRFQIVRVWETPSEELLKSGVGLLPLTSLGKPPPETTRAGAFRGQVEEILERVLHEASGDVGKLMTATYILSSIHLNPTTASEVINHMLDMRELPGYKFLLQEGAKDHAHEILLKLGRERWGEPNAKQVAKLEAIQDVERLDRMTVKVLSATGWDSLLRTR